MWATQSGGAYTQKVSLAIASNDIPDAMIVSSSQLIAMQQADQLQDLTGVINNYSTDRDKKAFSSDPDVLNAVTFDGKILAIPSTPVQYNSADLAWVRKDWLDNLSLPAPKTLDDLVNDAKAFINNDPDKNNKADTIGIAGPSNGGSLYSAFLTSGGVGKDFDPIFSNFDAFPGYWIKGSDGKAVYGSIAPETKTALAYLAQLYKDGVIDKQMSLRKDSTETVISGQCGIFFGPWWEGYDNITNAVKNDPKANWQAYPIPMSADGTFKLKTQAPSDRYLVVKKGYKYPEAVLKIININVRDESKFDVTKGDVNEEVLRLTIDYPDYCSVTVGALNDVLSGKKQPADFQPVTDSGYSLLQADVESIKSIKTQPYDNTDIQYWNPTANFTAWQRAYSMLAGYARFCDPSVKIAATKSLIWGQTATMQSNWVNLKKLEDTTFLKIIMGESSIDTFDQFVSDWKVQGGDADTKEVQDFADQQK